MDRDKFFRKTFIGLVLTIIASISIKLMLDSAYDLSFITEYNQRKNLEDKISENQSRKNDSVQADSEEYIEASSLANAENQAEVEQNDKSIIFKFLINTKTNRYHLKNCGAVAKLTDSKRGEIEVEADSIDEAEKILQSKGYSVCGLCKR